MEEELPGYVEKIEMLAKEVRAEGNAHFTLVLGGWKHEYTRDLLMTCLLHALRNGVPVMVLPPEFAVESGSDDGERSFEKGH